MGKIAYAPGPVQYAAAPVHYAPAQYAQAQYAAAPVQYAPAPVQYAPAPIQYAAPIAKLAYAAPVAKVAYAEPEAPAHYEFEYSVHDSHTGDIKQQKETRAGDAVQGSYSLVQPDGVQRIVDYTSDKVNGFNAVVRYEGHPTEAPHVTKVLAAPVQYAAPVAKVAYAPAGVQYASAPVQYAPAPVQYAPAPVQYAPAPVHYAPAPVHYAQASVAKVAYPANLGHVSYSSPAASYHH